MKKGEKMSDELKLKLSLVKKGKVFTDEHRANLSKAHIGKMPSNIETFKMSRKGYKMTEEEKVKHSECLRGRKMNYQSEETKARALNNLRTGVPWNKGKGEYMTGSKNPNWITDRNKLKEKYNRQIGSLHKEWVNACKKRDGKKCKLASKECIGKLEVHHIYRFSEYPELRYELSNGITLCHFHHPRKKSLEEELRELFIKLIS